VIFLLKKLQKPYLIAYILAGDLLSPQVIGVYRDTTSITNVGEIGIILLMFFLGIKINIRKILDLLVNSCFFMLTKTQP
jgi:CPA2 family monovalent cation:H+ antiporter-2